MPKAKTKAELITQTQKNWQKMWQMIEEMPEEMRFGTFKFGAEAGKEQHWGRDKNVRDLLVHLYEWHQLMLDFVAREAQPFLIPPYNWKTYGQMNVEFWKKHQETSDEAAETLVRESHEQVLQLLERYTDEDLFTKQYFDWTGTTSLGQYFQSALPAHYEWAMKKLRLHKKTF